MGKYFVLPRDDGRPVAVSQDVIVSEESLSLLPLRPSVCRKAVHVSIRENKKLLLRKLGKQLTFQARFKTSRCFQVLRG
ncbi:hypothetical protein EVAR_63781_1 [Eumeta japonica]|uniref:Uncharacterized protein n=1 Tax=Eumeta variegata TaxID=151549 RepID=A0A4C1ZJR4_EUMVA|nr:hypothetical protein EVAR_63781_1 [Eumeta japonica]